MQLQRIIRWGLSILLLFSLLIDTTGHHKYAFLGQLESWTYDARLNFNLSNSIDDRIVIIDIDEASLAAVGRWPWPRDTLATIINNLFDYYQVEVVGFDIVFAEKDRSSGLETFEELARGELVQNQAYQAALDKIRPSLHHDQIFAKSLGGKNLVMGYVFKIQSEAMKSANTGALPPPINRIDDRDRQRLSIIEAHGYSANLEILQIAAGSGGFFDNPLIGRDGVFRRVPLIQTYDGYLFSSLALAVTQAHLNNPRIKLVVPSKGLYYQLEAVNLGKHTIPVDGQGGVYVPYRGKKGSFQYLPAHQILNKQIDLAELKDKIVLVGTTAPGLLDLRSTPVDNIYPGVEVHANIISGILDDRISHKPAWTQGYEILLMLLLGFGMILLLPAVSPLMAALATILIALLTIFITIIAWNNHLILPLASPMLLIFLMFIFHMSYGFFIESRNKRKLAGQFAQYIPPELVDEMDKATNNFTLEGESRELTVLFTDVRGFTTISEGMEPKQLTLWMNAFLTPMTRIIHKYRGTIDKYMGDAIMAFWGAPLTNEDHARYTLYAALDMLDELKKLQTDFAKRGWPEVEIGIGINTGIMNVGNMGSEFRLTYTVLGDAVNLGSRLESLTKDYGVGIIVSETTKNSIPDYKFRELDLVRVKGKNEPVAIYEPVGKKNKVSNTVASELTRYKAALSEFRSQNWDVAEMNFINLKRDAPTRLLYKVYIDRIAYYRAQPPGADWDGVFTHTEK